MLEVAHTFIIYLTQNTEEIFSNVLELLNAPFTETKPKTKLDYEKALKGLDEAASRTFQKLIHESLAGVPIEQQRAYFHPLIEQHQAVIEQAMRQIVAINQNITHDHPPEQILDAITAYIRALEPLIQDDAAHRAKLAGASIEHAFYLTFHPFHHQLPKISEQLLTLQSTLHALQRAHSVGKSLSDMGQTLGRFSQTSQPPRETLVPTHLRPLLRQVQERASPTLSMSSHAIEPNLSHLVYLFGLSDSPPRLSRQNASQDLLRRPSLTSADSPPRPLNEQIPRTIQTIQGQIQSLLESAGGELAQQRRAVQTQMEELRRNTLELMRIQDSIHVVQLEQPWVGARALHRFVVSKTTPVAVDFFERVFSFITRPELYNASQRIAMQIFLDAYAPKRN